MDDTLDAYTARAQKIARKLNRIRSSGDSKQQKRAVETIRKARTGIVQTTENVDTVFRLAQHHKDMMQELYTFYVERAQKCIDKEKRLASEEPLSLYDVVPVNAVQDWVVPMQEKCDNCTAALNETTNAFKNITPKDGKKCKAPSALLAQYTEAIKRPYNTFLKAIKELREYMQKFSDDCLENEQDLRLPSIKFGYEFTPTCNGEKLPDDIKLWYDNKNDNTAEKILFCKLPGAMETVVEKVADTILNGPQKVFLDVLQKHTFSKNPSMGFKEGDRVGKFTVAHAAKGFLALERKKTGADDPGATRFGLPLAWWERLASFAQSVFGYFSSISGCISSAAKAIRSVAHYDVVKYSLVVAALGGAAYGLGPILSSWATLETAAKMPAEDFARATATATSMETPEFYSAMELHMAAKMKLAASASAAAAAANNVTIVAETAAKVALDILNTTAKTASTVFKQSATNTAKQQAEEAVNQMDYLKWANQFAKSPKKDLKRSAKIVQETAKAVKEQVERIIVKEGVVPSPNTTNTIFRQTISDTHFGGFPQALVSPLSDPITNLTCEAVFGDTPPEIRAEIEAKAAEPEIEERVEKQIASTAIATRYPIEKLVNRLAPFFGRVLTKENRSKLEYTFPQSLNKAKIEADIDVLLGKPSSAALASVIDRARAATSGETLRSPEARPPPQTLDKFVPSLIANLSPETKTAVAEAAVDIAHNTAPKPPQQTGATWWNFPSWQAGDRPALREQLQIEIDEEVKRALGGTRRAQRAAKRNLQREIDQAIKNDGSNEALTALRDEILTEAAAEIANKARDRGLRGILQREIDTLAKGEGGGVVDYPNAGAIADTAGDDWKGVLVGLALVSVITGNFPGLYLLGGALGAAGIAAPEAATVATAAQPTVEETLFAVTGMGV